MGVIFIADEELYPENTESDQSSRMFTGNKVYDMCFRKFKLSFHPQAPLLSPTPPLPYPSIY